MASDRDEYGRLTRVGMEGVLKEGGSVLHQGQNITNPADLPSPAVLARGDKRRAAAVKADLQAEIAHRQSMLASLDEPEEAAAEQSEEEAMARRFTPPAERAGVVEELVALKPDSDREELAGLDDAELRNLWVAANVEKAQEAERLLEEQRRDREGGAETRPARTRRAKKSEE